MSNLVAAKLGKGISPQQFQEGMTKNQEQFIAWYEQFAWQSEADEQFFESLSDRDDVRCLIIAADWCGDVVRNIPVVFRALAKSGIPVEVFIKEEHEDLMKEFEGKGIPVVIFADTGGFVLGKWGPRPAYVQAIMTAFKATDPDREAPDFQEKMLAVRQEMIRAYGEDTSYQHVVVSELKELLSSF
ncbi:thioredoxin family protein [Paenibacillus sp. N1-5-1-14]|uniref:thioredoxin family protein n=1 Tax=Paenibacillus radicibacter TaxID=2972488 RepID=UPI0021598B78|nr:thioredoxin family protein [Paenibacillus radicibacter]MCR8644734.1 thioredoxin family protein [Paenibacillus radicibacter]